MSTAEVQSQVIPSIPKGNAIFAIPKKGRLYEQCMKLIEGAGLHHVRVRDCAAAGETTHAAAC
jgi:hypothetical protein